MNTVRDQNRITMTVLCNSYKYSHMHKVNIKYNKREWAVCKIITAYRILVSMLTCKLIFYFILLLSR